jgi:epoxyqueuosine reductase
MRLNTFDDEGVPVRRGPIRRRTLALSHRAVEYLGTEWRFAGIITALARRHRPRLWIVPFPGTTVLRFLRSPLRPWRVGVPDLPAELRGVAGIRRDPARERAAHDRAPLHNWQFLHGATYFPAIRSMWPAQLVTAPSNARAMRRRLALNARPAPVGGPRPVAAAELKAHAAELGLSAVGITGYRPEYHFEEARAKRAGDTVIVCVLEQNFGSTQLIPSVRAEAAVMTTYGQLEERVVALGHWLRERGWTARAEGHVGESLAIAYGVAAGLGQLGLNGQLLTPAAGSRARLHVLTTNADLAHDEPVDYGIEAVCDRCRVCVERCPAGAIPAVRKEHRGVTKAKLNTKRCLPVLGMSAGCAVCMKVCPVQRYGLDAVVAEYRRTGAIRGKGADELEGYDWPVDGRHYGPGERPRIPAETYLVAPDFDPAREIPVSRTVSEQAGSFTHGLS